jgi:hypothetical protein
MKATRNRLVGIEKTLNVVSDDPFENVTIRTMLPLFHGARTLDEAPARVIRALGYMAVIQLAHTLNRATWASATDDERAEAARARNDWGLTEGAVSVDMLLELAEREGLTKAIVRRLRRELPPLLSAPDPDQSEAVPGHDLPPLEAKPGAE